MQQIYMEPLHGNCPAAQFKQPNGVSGGLLDLALVSRHKMLECMDSMSVAFQYIIDFTKPSIQNAPPNIKNEAAGEMLVPTC